jgi:predicted lipoprotein with Yx(FWY)xxD motif
MKSQTLAARASFTHRLARWAVAIATLATGFAFTATLLPSGAGATGATTVKLVSHGALGKILVNSAGMTVYIYTADSANKVTCTGGCAGVWPWVTVPKGTKPKGGPGVKGLGTVSTDGKLVLTWHQHPLYTYALDTGPGVVNGNAVKEGSGVWYAATAKNVSTSGTSPTTKTTTAGPSAGY